MQKRISRKAKKKNTKGRKDANQAAFSSVQRTIQLSESESGAEQGPIVLDKAMISSIMKELGAKGGRIGGKKSLETMTSAERSLRASKAAQARWGKKD